MKTIIATITIIGWFVSAFGATNQPLSNIIPASFESYGTLSYSGVDGKPTTGVGGLLGLSLSPTVQAIVWAETDNPKHETFDRAGAGLQLTGRLGKALRPFARLSFGYAFDSSSEPFAGLEAESYFVRPQFGANIDLWRWKKWHLSLTGSAGYDIDTKGNADLRVFGGVGFGRAF